MRLMGDQPHLVIAADSHGPYRTINTGMARLVRSYGGRVRPLSLSSTRSVSLFRNIHMALPLPGATVGAVIGAVNDSGSAGASIAASRENLARSLRDLESHALALATQ